MSDIPEINLNISITSIQAKPRKMRAKWSVQAAQDLRLLWKFRVGDYVIDKVTGRLSKIVLPWVESYDCTVEDVETGAQHHRNYRDIDGPLSALEILAAA